MEVVSCFFYQTTNVVIVINFKLSMFPAPKVLSIMRHPKIFVIGGSVTGCLTAALIAQKYPNLDLTLIDNSDRLLSSLNSIELAGHEVNNGFHAIELPRAEEFFNFLKKNLNQEWAISDSRRWLSIEGHLVDFNSRLHEWPNSLKPYFHTSSLTAAKPSRPLTSMREYWQFATEQYKAILFRVARRYSDTPSQMNRFLMPWFFPADFDLKLNDEGRAFISKIRSGEVSPQLVQPKGAPFSCLSDGFNMLMGELKVKVSKGEKVVFSKNSIKCDSVYKQADLSASSEDLVFVCTSPAVILKQTNERAFSNLTENQRFFANALVKIPKSASLDLPPFSELLCANSSVAHISRISCPQTNSIIDSSAGGRILQVEILARDKEEILTCIETLSSDLKKILKVSKKTQIAVLDAKISRSMYFPDEQSVSEGIKLIDDWAQQFNGSVFINHSFSPPNMAKAWITAKENLKIIENRHF